MAGEAIGLTVIILLKEYSVTISFKYLTFYPYATLTLIQETSLNGAWWIYSVMTDRRAERK